MRLGRRRSLLADWCVRVAEARVLAGSAVCSLQKKSKHKLNQHGVPIVCSMRHVLFACAALVFFRSVSKKTCAFLSADRRVGSGSKSLLAERVIPVSGPTAWGFYWDSCQRSNRVGILWGFLSAVQPTCPCGADVCVILHGQHPGKFVEAPRKVC